MEKISSLDRQETISWGQAEAENLMMPQAELDKRIECREMWQSCRFQEAVSTPRTRTGAVLVVFAGVCHA